MNKTITPQYKERYNWLIDELCSLEAVSLGYDSSKVNMYRNELMHILADIETMGLKVKYKEAKTWRPFAKRKIDTIL